jgi:multidrug resistance efflux pump
MNRTVEEPRWEHLERHLLPAHELPESLEAHLVRPSTGGLWLFWGFASALLAGAIWGALTQLDITVRCRGYIRSVVPAQTLHSPLDGIVEAVFVRLHQQVRQGDTLLRLRDTELRLRLRTASEELQRHEALFAEISTLLRLLPEGGTPEHMAAAFPSHTRWRTPLVRSLAELIRKDLQLFARNHETLAKQWERTSALYQKQLVSTEQYEAALSELRLQELRALQYIQSRRQELTQRLEDLEHHIQELRQLLGTLQEQLRKSVIVANIDGQITRLLVPEAGAFVSAGQELLTITPQAQPEAELLVLPQDILLVRPGQRVRYRLASSPLGQEATLWGTVRSIAEDITAEGNLLAYRLRASLDSSATPLSLPLSQLRKGLPVEATIYIGRKPLLQWLLDRSRRLWQESSPSGS